MKNFLGESSELASHSGGAAETVARESIEAGRSSFPIHPGGAAGGAFRKTAKNLGQEKLFNDAVNSAHGEGLGMNSEITKERGITDLFSSNGKTPGIGRGAMIGGGFALGGSMLYGGAHMASPNNADVNNPLKNVFGGAVAGAAAAGAMMLSHNASLSKNFVKAAKSSDSWWMAKAYKSAPMVRNALNNNVTKGAIGAGLIAGSGQFDLTRPVNPVY